MKIERHETGPRMSKAVIHGDTVYLAGIVADSPKGKSTAEQPFVVWRLDRIVKQIEAISADIKVEIAELLGNEDRASE